MVKSLEVGRCLEWEAAGGVVVFWDNRVLQLVEMEVGKFIVSCRFKNCEDGFRWGFSGVYGTTVKVEREVFWSELGAILRNGPWCVAGDFNMIRFPSERSREGRLFLTMRRFSEVVEELELRDLPLQGGCSRGVEVSIIGQSQELIISLFLRIGKLIFRGLSKLYWLGRFLITLRFFLMGEE